MYGYPTSQHRHDADLYGYPTSQHYHDADLYSHQTNQHRHDADLYGYPTSQHHHDADLYGYPTSQHRVKTYRCDPFDNVSNSTTLYLNVMIYYYALYSDYKGALFRASFNNRGKMISKYN